MDLIFKRLPCPTCFQTHVLDVHLAEKEHCGFAVKITVVCTQCEHEILNMFSCQRIDGSSSSRQPFDVNLRAVLAFRGIGSGFSSMNDWCGIMNFPNCLAHKSYSSNQSKLREASMETFDRISKDSIKSITAAYEAIGTKPDEQGVLDIAVSYDGTWQKRGHSSHNGIGCVIDLITGLPIDYEVLSNFCLKCKIASEDHNTTNEWRAAHAEKCTKNFHGSANSMEAEAAKRLWQRSIPKHKLRYTTVLSDGDSKSYDALVEGKVYGEVKIEKEECVNHVSKRMGKALRNLVDECKSQKQSISGRGKLTAIMMTKIQNYYGHAIKDHSWDVELMRNRIFAILFHLSSCFDQLFIKTFFSIL